MQFAKLNANTINFSHFDIKIFSLESIDREEAAFNCCMPGAVFYISPSMTGYSESQYTETKRYLRMEDNLIVHSGFILLCCRGFDKGLATKVSFIDCVIVTIYIDLLARCFNSAQVNTLILQSVIHFIILLGDEEVGQRIYQTIKYNFIFIFHVLKGP